MFRLPVPTIWFTLHPEHAHVLILSVFLSSPPPSSNLKMVLGTLSLVPLKCFLFCYHFRGWFKSETFLVGTAPGSCAGFQPCMDGMDRVDTVVDPGRKSTAVFFFKSFREHKYYRKVAFRLNFSVMESSVDRPLWEVFPRRLLCEGAFSELCLLILPPT